MGTVFWEIVVIFLLIAANGAFAMSEIAIVSARKARLQQYANEGDARAKAALDLANAPNQLLSTSQVGITLVGVLTGAYGGATLADQLAAFLHRVPLLAPHSQILGLTIVVLGVTYFSLILGELVPKRLALHNPERVASAVAGPMNALSRIASPVVRLLSFSTDLALRAFRVGPSNEAPVTEEEIRVLLEQGTRAGLFEEAEQDMVERVFRLGDRRVSVIMTPRTDVAWLDVDDAPGKTWAKIAEGDFSRYPVAQGSIDNLLGIVHVKALLSQTAAGRPIDLRAALAHPLFVPESMRALKILELFKQSGTHIAIVINEYGGIEGIVTFDDILEAIVGDIPSPEEGDEPLVIERDDGSWLVDGMLPADELKELLDVDALPGEDRGDFQTLGGFVMTFLGHIPSPAEHFFWENFRFEVLDMDGNRVDKVLVARATEPRLGEE